VQFSFKITIPGSCTA